MVKVWTDHGLIVDNPQYSFAFLYHSLPFLRPSPTRRYCVASRSPSIRKLSLPRPSSLSSPLDASIYLRVCRAWERFGSGDFIWFSCNFSLSLFFMCHFFVLRPYFFWFWSLRKLDPTWISKFFFIYNRLNIQFSSLETSPYHYFYRFCKKPD
jgi:hypothetical protein